MFVRRLVTLVTVLASLAVLSLLVWKSQQRPLDSILVGQQLAGLADARTTAQSLEQELTTLRVQRQTDFASLDLLQSQWLVASERLAQPDLGIVNSNRIAPKLKQYQQAVVEATVALRGFRLQQPEFVDAFTAFRKQAEVSLQELVATSQGESLRISVLSLVDEVAKYSLQLRPDNGEAIDALLLRIAQPLPNLNASARGLRAAKDQLQATVNTLTELPILAGLDQLEQGILDAVRQQDDAAQQYTLALAAFASALLLVFGLIGLRLQSSYGALDAINANLEKLVEQRTGELNQALNELRLQQVHLIQSEKLASLGQMVAGVAHEINTPLGYALSNVETVKESMALVNEAGGLSDDATERLVEADVLLEDSMHGMAQIDELVKSLKNFSRMDRSGTELFDLNEGLDLALKICNNSLKDKVEIEKHYAADLPSVHCAPSQLNQVFLNLINNGSQAIEGKGVIKLSTKYTEDAVEVRIADTGCGMDAETQAHIFEPFFTTKPVGEGTGLGLSIVFRIIEDHGGRITVNSKPGEGSEFVISLPLDQKPAPEQLFEPDVESMATASA